MASQTWTNSFSRARSPSLRASQNSISGSPRTNSMAKYGRPDPVTPPSNAVAAMKFLTRARHVLLAGEGHGQLGVRCMDRVFEEFLRHGEPAKLDLTCLDKRVVPPFFLTPAGPGP